MSREQFEKLPRIAETLNRVEWDDDVKRYRPINSDKDAIQAAKTNGAYYAYQEQQGKIDAIVSIVREADLSNGDSSVAIVHDEIKELLK